MPDNEVNGWDHAIEKAPVGVFRTTAQGRFLFANQELASIFGYDTPAELLEKIKDIGRDLLRDSNQRAEVLALLDEHGHVNNYVYEAKAKDKTVRFVSFSARKVQDSDGDFYYEGFMLDITEQKLAEDRLKNILGEIQGMAYRCKPAHPWEMIWVSDGCRELTGYHKEDIEKQKPIYGDLIWETHQHEVSHTVGEAIESNTTFTLVYPIRTSNKEKKWVFERGRAVRDENNKVLYLEGVVQNYNEDRDWYQREHQEIEIKNLHQNLYLRREMWWAVIVVFTIANLTMVSIIIEMAVSGSLSEHSFVYCFGLTVGEMAAIMFTITKYIFPFKKGSEKEPQEGDKSDGTAEPYPNDFQEDEPDKPKPKREKVPKK
jgi:PAS domain S-box-containing protein